MGNILCSSSSTTLLEPRAAWISTNSMREACINCLTVLNWQKLKTCFPLICSAFFNKNTFSNCSSISKHYWWKKILHQLRLVTVGISLIPLIPIVFLEASTVPGPCRSWHHWSCRPRHTVAARWSVWPCPLSRHGHAWRSELYRIQGGHFFDIPLMPSPWMYGVLIWRFPKMMVPPNHPF